MFGLMFIAGFFSVLAACGVFSDYIFPRVKPLNRYLDSLPPYDND